MITLTPISGDEYDAITLPKECIWQDEFSWQAVKSKTYYTVTGDFIVDSVTANKGRPITIGGENAWILRQNLLTLYDWCNTSGMILTLKLHDNREFKVMFRNWEEPVFEWSTPTNGYADPKNTYFYAMTLKLAEVM